MPELSKAEATEKLAVGVEKAKPSVLPEIYAELFPERPRGAPGRERDRRHIRGGLEAEEIVDLWNVVFPEDRNVWYDEETRAIHFNEEMAGYAGLSESLARIGLEELYVARHRPPALRRRHRAGPRDRSAR